MGINFTAGRCRRQPAHLGSRAAIGMAVAASERATSEFQWSKWDERHRTHRDRGNGADGIGDIEGKTVTGNGERVRATSEFQWRALGSRDIEHVASEGMERLGKAT
jgi:hypothetical protein